ncbi:cholinephosphotransferase 1 isoform X4 [Frankliniella occidentalis]|uniref:diacylglycerol cholinephosphotransferase n=1 Tax=Frankliniella occidentalis TaxID=133901 RepID=A0A9C6UBK7_FRAOC|nr:cholinephosphotransferase 1 isoform X4 [Frankliniella occidentalis]
MHFYKEKILSDGQLKRLSEHKYNSESQSLLDAWLQPWWNWLVRQVPIWLAPNLITLSGLIINIVTTLILIYYSPDAKSDAPRWAFFLCGVGLFAYQSLDAIDGKQARRTGTSSPLGELFDHGCDSISTVFVAISACIAVQLGYYPTWMFFQCFCAMTLFYCAHWQTYVSGTLRFGKLDVTEAQITIMFIHLISTIFGPSIWMAKIPPLEYFELRYVIGMFTILGATLNLYNMFLVIISGGGGKNGSTVAVPVANVSFNVIASIGTFTGYLRNFFQFCQVFETGGVGKNGSSVAGTSVLSPIIPFGLVVVPAYIIYRKSVQAVYENNPVLYILAFGMVAAKVTNRLVVAHMTKNEMEYFDSALIGPLMLFLNQYFNFYIPEYIVLWMCLVWVMFDLMRYCSAVCLEICNYLRIQLFRIPSGGGPAVHSGPTSVTDKNGAASAQGVLNAFAGLARQHDGRPAAGPVQTQMGRLQPRQGRGSSESLVDLRTER